MSVAAAGLLALTACSSDGGSNTNADGTHDVEILLPFPEGLSLAPLVVGQANGTFEENGINLTVSVADGSGYLTQQLISGNVEFALMGSADIVIAANQRDDIRVLFCNQVNNVYRIMATVESGITDIEGLRGKAIGITEPGGGENQYVQAALADAGLQSPGDIEVLPVGAAGPQVLSAIENGTIQAYSSSFPDIASLTASGVEWVDITPERYSAVPGTCMTTTQDVLDTEDGLERAKALAKSWVDSQYFVLENQKESFDIVCAEIPEACENPDAAAALFEEAINVIEPDSADQRPGEVSMESWETVVAILSESGVVDAGLNMTNVVTGPSIDAVTEFAYSDH